MATPSFITISHPTGILKGTVNLPSSKSESNRLLIIQALSEGRVSVSNLSPAHDTELMQAALTSSDQIVDIEDAGTAMRFLTAYYCITGQHRILRGSDRMHVRPIAPLVDALRHIGFDVRYQATEGCPPIEILPSTATLRHEVEVQANVSSQFISALLMIAPLLPEGLTILHIGDLYSRPYVQLTLDIMAQAGIRYEWIEHCIHIGPQQYTEAHIAAAADWSGAGYWYSMAALAREADIRFPRLHARSAQGDRIISDWMLPLGLESREQADMRLTKVAPAFRRDLHFDFIDQPDLAQTIIVLCAALSLQASFTGLDSLRLKETDRIEALRAELSKFGVALTEKEYGLFVLNGQFAISNKRIRTYDDHRMAMAFAPLALLGEISIEAPSVVRKSYPHFWEDMKQMGFVITEEQ